MSAVGDPVSRPLFTAFGQAVADWAKGVRPVAAGQMAGQAAR